MRRILPILLLLITPVLLHAQDLQSEARHHLATLGVSNAEINKIVQIQTETRFQVREAQLELNVLKAELERALFPINVDMNKVHQLLQESLQWKMKSELATIQERVELRKILGDYKYAEYRRFVVNAARNARGRIGSGGASNAGTTP
ncbi:MAG TPA: hypothetical protein VMW69_11355 [Spirochaetia bacterium]|nr:hypothetical protein [Spirochaetia bacterium]